MGSPPRGGDVVVYVFDRNQPSLPAPFFFFFNPIFVSVSVFTAPSTVFLSINPPEKSLLFHSVLAAILVLSTIYLFMKVSLSPDIIHCGY